MPETVSFWSEVWARMKAVWRWLAVKLAAPGVALIIILVAILLVAMGCKELQIGGLLSRLFGKKTPGERAIDVANTPPADRVDPKGNLIPPGVPDSKGQTQAVVVPIKEPGLFSNPDTVTFVPPGETEPIEVQLPDGVKNKDVEKVVVVQPGKFVVTVSDKSNIPASTVDSLLKKYGG
jgi:hypothetical protein